MEIDPPDRLEVLRLEFEQEDIKLQKRISEYQSHKESKSQGILGFLNPVNYKEPISSDDVFSNLDIRHNVNVDINSVSTVYDTNPERIIYPRRVDRGNMDRPSSFKEGTFKNYYEEALLFMLIYESHLRYLFWVLSDDLVNTDQKCLHVKALTTELLKYINIKRALNDIHVTENDKKTRLYLLVDSLHTLVKSHILAFKQNIDKFYSVCNNKNLIIKANHIIKLIETEKKPNSYDIMQNLFNKFSSKSSKNSTILKKHDINDGTSKISDKLDLETYGQIQLGDKEVLATDPPQVEYPTNITVGLDPLTKFKGVEKDIEEKLRDILIYEDKMRFILSVIGTDNVRMQLKCAYAIDFQKILSSYYSAIPSIIDIMNKHENIQNSKYPEIISFMESQVDTHLLKFSEISKQLDLLCIQSGILKNQNIIQRLTLDKTGESMLYYTILENIVFDLSRVHLKLSEDVQIILSGSSKDKYDTCNKSLQYITDYDLSLQENIYEETLEKIRKSAGHYQVTSLLDDMSLRVLGAFNLLEESMDLIKRKCDNIEKPMDIDSEPVLEPDLNSMFENIGDIPNDVFRNGRRRRGVSSKRVDFVPCTTEEECMRRLIHENKKLDDEQNDFYEKSIKKSLQNYLTTANYYINLEKKIDNLKKEIRSHIQGLVSDEMVLGKRKSPIGQEKTKKPKTKYRDDKELENILLELDADLESAILKSKPEQQKSDENNKDKILEEKIQKANEMLFEMKVDRSINGIKDINNTRKYDIVNEKGKGYLYLYKMLVKMATYRKEYKKSDDKEISMELGIINMLDIKGKYKPDSDGNGGDNDDGADDVSPPVANSRKTARLTRSG